MNEEFFEYLRHESVSADPSRSGDVLACAEWLLGWLEDAGMEGCLMETGGPPVVFAKSPEIPGAPTLLLYGHYDVQPAGTEPPWQSPPFEPEIRLGHIYARGATDNKGQTFSLLLGLRAMLRDHRLRTNIRVVIEGEEEVGSPHFEEFLKRHQADLTCDAVVIADTSMVAADHPALTNGLRGISCFEVRVQGPENDLHSGMFGGAVPNPALALAHILTSMIGNDGGITIPGFYHGIIPPSTGELAGWESLPWNDAWFEKATGIAPRGGEKDFSILERVWARPTAEINGLTSGYQGSGSKTIIPSLASAKLSFRLVPGQTTDRVRPLIEDWFRDQFSRYGVSGEIVHDHGGEPFFVSPQDPALRKASRALEKVFHKAPTLTREGLSIPAAVMLQQTLRVPVLLTGLGLPDCNAHGPNESFPVSHMDLGQQVFCAIVEEFAT